LAAGASAQTAGDAQAGAQKNALCVGCHGINGYHTAFPQAHKVPKLSGQSEAYLAAALQAYRAGERKHPSMRTLAASLSDQDMADLAAYYASTGPKAAATPATAGGGKAQELITKGGCTSCHGDNFSRPVAPTYPKIAGQHSDYLYVALQSYKTQNKPMIGRGNPIMAGIASQFSNAELKTIADYLGSLPGELATVQPARLK